MPHRGGCDRENWTETAFKRESVPSIYLRKRKGIVERVNVILPNPHFPRRNQNRMTRIARCIGGCTSLWSGKRISYDEPWTSFSPRHPVYSVHAARWANGAPERWSNGLRRGLSSLYFYFTRIPQLPRECISRLIRFSYDQGNCSLARYYSFLFFFFCLFKPEPFNPVTY